MVSSLSVTTLDSEQNFLELQSISRDFCQVQLCDICVVRDTDVPSCSHLSNDWIDTHCSMEDIELCCFRFSCYPIFIYFLIQRQNGKEQRHKQHISFFNFPVLSCDSSAAALDLLCHWTYCAGVTAGICSPPQTHTLVLSSQPVMLPGE